MRTDQRQKYWRVDRQNEQDREAKLRDLDAALARGIADADAGRVTPIREAFARIRARLGMAEEGQAE